MRFKKKEVRWLRMPLAAALIVLVAGCAGSQGPETVDVAGKVTFNGSPLEGANVTFHPLETSDNALASQAVTDADGRFRLTTHVGKGRFKDGITPGKYSVVITKLDTAAIKSTLAPPKNMLPGKYGNASTSGLTADVRVGEENELSFNLDAD